MRAARVLLRASDGRRIIIRPLKRDDILPLMRFANTLSREKETNQDLGIVSLDKRVAKEEELEFLNRIIAGRRTKDEISLAAFDGARMVGHCHVSRRRQRDVRHTGILGISVIDGYRGLGIGSRLTAEVLEQTLRVGVWLVELEVMGINEAAIGLYEKMGFRRAGVIPNKILRKGRHIDIVVMYADLRGSDKFLSPARREVDTRSYHRTHVLRKDIGADQAR
ncbi:MAG TPA: GNAT family N-acetyltransferase [Nitrososphaerales archaeon]|nr:GNAT family N-acetyltransferase [Nitrososphaerales archaeon]